MLSATSKFMLIAHNSNPGGRALREDLRRLGRETGAGWIQMEVRVRARCAATRSSCCLAHPPSCLPLASREIKRSRCSKVAGGAAAAAISTVLTAPRTRRSLSQFPVGSYPTEPFKLRVVVRLVRSPPALRNATCSCQRGLAVHAAAPTSSRLL